MLAISLNTFISCRLFWTVDGKIGRVGGRVGLVTTIFSLSCNFICWTSPVVCANVQIKPDFRINMSKGREIRKQLVKAEIQLA